ncbi:unnamed protein product [Calicophoron daubneyi]|uniref:Cytosol aminopeptidase domain-containing protein n=1 Tax=Calicophoron daubneyi TaxID=300641 RepID=A0AAV2U0Q6_CALDB
MTTMTSPFLLVTDVLDDRFDVVIFVNDSITDLSADDTVIQKALNEFSQVNPKLNEEITVLPFPTHPAGRLIFTPTGALNTDTADVRNVYEAACKGVQRAVSCGFKSPMLCIGPLRTASSEMPWMERRNIVLAVMLGAYCAIYTPIEVREMCPKQYPKATQLGIMGADELLIKIATAIEEGRWLARDIGGSDPERMCASRIVEHLTAEMADLKGIKMTVESINELKYPLMAAVNRASALIPRHDGRVVHLNYTPPNPDDIDTTLFLVGKGITYDTGGADLKTGGVMAGMHRDKCGAAAIAGLFKTLAYLQPPGLAAHGLLAFVRNNFGSNAYVSDEIIVACSGQRIRVGNTDAEGRMVMADLLCEAREKALSAKNPFLFTIATLTGHVIRTYGDAYAALMDNGPARRLHVSQELQAAGDLVADLSEISTIRREDYEANKGKSELEDILQCNNLPSSQTPRGHQIPGAFLTMASGLSNHGLDSSKPIPYTHIDVAGSAGAIHKQPTASPLLMFARRYVLPRIGIK